MKDKPTYQDIQAALKDGNLEAVDIKALWRCHDRIFELSRSMNPTEHLQMTAEVEQTLLALRHLISLKVSARDQRKAIRWARIAGVAAIVAAVFGGIAAAPILHDWCRSSSQALFPKADKPASISLPPLVLVSPPTYTGVSTIIVLWKKGRGLCRLARLADFGKLHHHFIFSLEPIV